VSYTCKWVDDVTEISDHFLWPKAIRDVKSMKMFAINYLSDIFGRNLKSFLTSHISGFANFVAYVICREIDLARHMDSFSIESMVKDGIFGHGAGIGYGEHLITLNLSFKDF